MTLPTAPNAPVVILGAGPAGIRAAETLVAAGVDPVIIDEAPRSGGQIYRQPPHPLHRRNRDLYGFEWRKAASLHATADTLSNRLRMRYNTLVWNARPGTLDIICNGKSETQVFSRIIIASGAADRIIPFDGWTLPGVFSLGATQIALKYQNSLTGQRIVFAGTGPLLYLVAYQYAKAGAKVQAILDSSSLMQQIRSSIPMMSAPGALAKGLYFIAWLRANGVPIKYAAFPAGVTGDQKVERLHAKCDGIGLEYDCDAVATGYGLRSETQLADLLDCDFHFDDLNRAWLPQTDSCGRASKQGVYLAGDGASIGGADHAELAGERVAMALLEDMDIPFDGKRAIRIDKKAATSQKFRKGLHQAFPLPAIQSFALDDSVILCRCEEITVGQAVCAIKDQNIQTISRLKAMTRVGMGLCQGRLCQTACAELLALHSNQSIDQVGRLRTQSPVKPLSIHELRSPEDP